MKIYLMLFLVAVTITPDCCAMKRVPNIVKKCIQFKSYKILDKYGNVVKEDKTTFAEKWNRNAVKFFKYCLIGTAVGANGDVSYMSAKDRELLLWSVPFTIAGEITIVSFLKKGPVGLYTALQAVFFCKGLYDEKKETKKLK